MHSFHFVGLVHPQGGSWYLEAPIIHDDGETKTSVIIGNSAFNATVETSSADAPDTVWNRTESFVRGVLDSIGFHRAAALSIELTGGSMDGKVPVLVNYSWNELAETKTSHIEGDALVPYALAAGDNPLVRHALADLRAALQSPDDTGFYCYRAIESIRHNYTEISDKGDNLSWERLRSNLDVPRSEIDSVKKLADD